MKIIPEWTPFPDHEADFDGPMLVKDAKGRVMLLSDDMQWVNFMEKGNYVSRTGFYAESTGCGCCSSQHDVHLTHYCTLDWD